jgi:hypothetical protein
VAGLVADLKNPVWQVWQVVWARSVLRDAPLTNKPCEAGLLQSPASNSRNKQARAVLCAYCFHRSLTRSIARPGDAVERLGG